MLNTDFAQWFNIFQQQANVLNERRLIVLVGEEEWAHSLLQSIDSFNHNVNSQDENSWLIYGDSGLIKANVSPKRFRDKLGTESNFVVFTQLNLTIDAFAALSGTLVAGGIFFLLINDIALIKKSNFFKRFFTLLQNHSEHVIIDQASQILPSLNQSNNKHIIDRSNISDSQVLNYGCVTQDQMTAVEAIIHVIKGKSKRPLVLTADRGRGKSSALAIACAQLLIAAKNENKLHIIITAAELNSVQIFFNQLTVSLPQGHQEGSKYIVAHGLVEFVAIDKLLKLKPKVSLILVDEAAAIPVYLLEELLFHHSRIVFTSTVHGYEGAGRGFTLKFQQTLATSFPKWRSLHINKPIRWRTGDPLEQLVFDSCLLNAELSAIEIPSDKLVNNALSYTKSSNEISDCQNTNLVLTDTQRVFKNLTFNKLTFKQLTAEALVVNDNLLRQVFAILVTAHYQTKPSDVQMLLDNKQVQLVCLISENEGLEQVIAVALLINEGQINNQKITEDELQAVKKSQKRLRNNFVPQSLLTQCGMEKAFDYHYLRVMRIAVHPQVQSQGLGSLFLNKISTFAKAQDVDFLASSFGATKQLLSFWLSSGFQLGRIGFSKDKASGEQSALVLKSLSNNTEKALTVINTEFYRCFDYLLVEEYKYLSPNLVTLIQQYYPQPSLLVLSALDNANVAEFAHGYRQYSSCVFSLHLWLKHRLCTQPENDETLPILISRIMQKHSINDVCRRYNFTGKKALEQFLRSCVMSTLKAS
jgi:tRNA(Met) cytidine acetyltransferase